MAPGGFRRTWVRRSARLAAFAVTVVAAVVVLLHANPARRAVLARAAVFVERNYGIKLQASRLDYNLLRLDLTLSDLRLASTRTPALPFLQADRLDLQLPWSVLRGPLVIRSISVGHLQVRIGRSADGTTNLPSSPPGSGAEPASLPIDRLQVDRLDVEVTDAPSGFGVALDGGSLDLTAGGRVQFPRGTIRQRDTFTAVRGVEGGMAFDGQTLRFDTLRVTTDDAAIEATGTVDVLAADPRLELTVSGAGDLPGLARWATDAAVPAGSVTVAGTLAGPLSAPRAAVRAHSDALSWRGLRATAVDGDVVVEPDRLRLSRLDGDLAGGRLLLRGEASFASSETVLDLSWNRIDVGVLARALAPPMRMRPAARATGSAALRGRGTDLGGWTLTAQTVLDAAATARDRLAVGGTLAARVEDGGWRLAADLSAGSLPLAARAGGRVNADAPLASTIAGTLESQGADLRALVQTLTQLGLITATGDAIDGRATTTAQVSGTLGAPLFDVSGRVSGLSAAGLSGVTADFTGRGTATEARLMVAARQSTGNALELRGTIRPAEGRIDSRIAGRLPDLPALSLPAAGGIVELNLEAMGPFEDLEIRGGVHVAGARYDWFAAGDIDATIALGARTASVDARAAELGSRLRATLDRANRRVLVQLDATDADLARLVPGDAPVPVSGRVSLGAAVEGPLDRWEDGSASVDVAALSARVSNVPVELAFPARADYLDGVVMLGESVARVGDLRLLLAGRIPLRSRTPPVPDVQALVAEVDGDVTGLLNTMRAAGLTVEDLMAAGPVALRARIGGSLERIAAVANIEGGPGTLRAGDLPAVDRLQLMARVDGERLVVTEATGEWQGSRLAAEASVPLGLFAPFVPARVASALPPSTEPATLTLRTDTLTPRVLEPFVGPEVLQQLGGSVALSAAVQASALDLESLRGEVRLDRLDLSVAGLPVTQSEPTRVVAAGGIARVAAWQWQGPDSVMRVGGQIGLANRQAALLVGGVFDLRLLAPLLSGTGVAVTGRLEPRISVVGPVEQPIVEGELVLTNGEVRLETPQVIATNLDAFAVLTPDGLGLTRLTGRVNGGTATANGSLQYEESSPPATGLKASVTGMALDFPAGLRSELDAELSLAVSRPQPGGEPRGRLSGTVTVARGAYREPISVVNELLAALRPERRALAASGSASALAWLDLDLGVVTDDDVVVRNNLAQIQLGADLRVIGTGAAPSLSGRATLREGGTLALGNNRYTIDQGTIDFSNPAVIEPRLSIQAHTRAGGEDIELVLAGTPATLDVSLSSPSDPLLSEADVASLLLTGRRLEDVPGAEARIVGEQVLGYLSGDVLGAAGRAIRLDTVRLGGLDDDVSRTASTIATQTDPTSRMTFMKSFEPFEVTLSQGLRNAAQTWVVDYTSRRRLVLRLVSRDDTLRSYEIRQDLLLGTPPAAPRPERVSAALRRVGAVTLEGDLAVPEADLRRALRLSAGQEFDAGTWQADRDRLETMLRRAGYFEARVAASMAEHDDGIGLTYRVASGPRTTMRIDGYDLPAPVEDAIREAWASSIADATLRVDVTTLVGRALAERGYMQATVAVTVDRVEGDGRGEKTLRIDISPGAQITQRAVRLEPAGLALTEDIQQSLGAAPLLELAEAGSSPLARALTDALRDRGYVQGAARVEGPVLEGDTATWIATLSPGVPFTVGTVVLDGGGPGAALALGDLEAGGFVAGAPFTPAALDAAVSTVVQGYRRRGYTRAAVTPRLVLQPEGRANVTLAVAEGRQQVLDRLVIEGNRAVRAEEITRVLDLDVGAPLANDAWLDARTRVFQTGLFSRVDVSTEEAEAAGPDRIVPVTVRVAVQEWPALRLRYGFQLSEEWRDFDPLNGREITPGVSADATRRSLFGRAVTLGAAVVYRRREQQTRVFASAPRLWGRGIESLVSVQRSQTDITGDPLLTRDIAGVSWEQRARVADRVELSYSYRFERNHTFDPDPPADPLFPVLDIMVNVARLVGTAAFDSRDDLFDSRQGTFASSSLEYAPEALGSTSGITFVKSLTQLYYFRPWRGVVLASAARVGLARGLSGVALIPTERFRTGGARTVRGVEEESLGPRDPIFGDVVGGNALLVFNQEMRFPVYRWLRGAAFVDAGNVFAQPRDVSLGALVGSSGAGLRLTTPFGLLRVDYGRLWSPGEGQAAGRWSFGIGQVF